MLNPQNLVLLLLVVSCWSTLSAQPDCSACERAEDAAHKKVKKCEDDAADQMADFYKDRDAAVLSCGKQQDVVRKELQAEKLKDVATCDKEKRELKRKIEGESRDIFKEISQKGKELHKVERENDKAFHQKTKCSIQLESKKLDLPKQGIEVLVSAPDLSNKAESDRLLNLIWFFLGTNIISAGCVAKLYIAGKKFGTDERQKLLPLTS